MRITYGVNLGVAPAFCAANVLNKGPPLPPPAQRCPLMWVLSMDISSGEPARAAVSSRNIIASDPFVTSGYSDCTPWLMGRIAMGNPASGNLIAEHE